MSYYYSSTGSPEKHEGTIPEPEQQTIIDRRHL